MFGNPDSQAVLAQNGHTVPITDIERQIRWEHQAVERGIKKYREVVYGKDAKLTFGETTPGIRLIADVCKTFIPALDKIRAGADESISKAGSGRRPEWAYAVSMLSTEKLALITLRSVLAFRPDESTVNRPVTPVANAIATAIKEQINFERWRDETREAARKLKDAGLDNQASENQEVSEYVKLLGRLKQAQGMTARHWNRFQSKIKRVRDEPWGSEFKIQLGGALLEALAEHGGGWFEIILANIKGGKTQKQIVLSDEAKAALKDMETAAELSRPAMLPMICPPKPWVWTAVEKKED